MVSFYSKKINKKKSISDILKEAREKQNFSINFVAQKLNFSPKFIQALENGQFNLLPGEIYAKNFIEKYATFLQLDKNDLMKKYSSSRLNLIVPQKLNNKKFIPACHLFNISSLLRLGVIFSLMACLLIYLGWEFGGIFKSPPLQIFSPEEGLISSIPLIEIKGQTLPETRVQINGVEITSNGEGNFSEKINLNPGSNKIIVVVTKKHGRSASLVRNVIYKDKNGGISLK